MVVAPAPPPLAGVAPVVTAQVLEALEPWSAGTCLANFVGNADEEARSRTWSWRESSWQPSATTPAS